jgi:hypothetical protein
LVSNIYPDRTEKYKFEDLSEKPAGLEDAKQPKSGGIMAGPGI